MNLYLRLLRLWLKVRRGPVEQQLNSSRLPLRVWPTGRSPLYIEGKGLQWGLSQWAKPLLGVMFDAGVGMVDYQCRQILGSRYHRLNPWLDAEPIQLDDADALPRLERAANAAELDASLAWFEQVWMAA